MALFAGAGGGLLASYLLRWRTVCAVEINEYCRASLAARQNDGTLPGFPIWDDIKTFDGKPWRGRVDVVSGGFPCQAYSTAARGRSKAAELWPEMRRVVTEVAPRFVFAENTSKAAIEWAADDLEALGYKTHCIALSAADLGALHDRKRYWLRAYTDYEGQLCSGFNAEMAELPDIRKALWGAFPGEPGMASRLAHRMDRFRAIGNGQVPLVAATAWRAMTASNPGGKS